LYHFRFSTPLIRYNLYLFASRDQVKLYVGYLRRKLEGAGADGTVIETVRGFGYRYKPSAA
jgi:DNA-binding response OmpR family regulator